MKKLSITIGIVIIIALSLLFAYRPVPPFAGVSPTPISQAEATYFAELDKNGEVLRVLVVTQDFINTGKLGDPKNWVETKIDGSVRKNYAGKGYKYDKTLNAFIPPKPKLNWVLDPVKAQWKDPNVIIPTASI